MHLLPLLSLLLCLSYTSHAQINLPDIGNSAQVILSSNQQKQLGDEFLRELRKQRLLLEDVQIHQYINALGQRLASHSDNPEQAYRFYIIDNKEINAFATFGGLIVIHTGLVLTTQNEDELAAVMAHEIAHVSQQHLLRNIEDQQKLSLPAIAAMLASIAIAAIEPEAAAGAMASMQAGMAQLQIDTIRGFEKEADRVGIKMLAAAGFNAQSMADFFARLQINNRYNNSERLPEFLRTHPITYNRIAEAQSLAAQHSAVETQADNAMYHLLKARLLVQQNENPAKLSQTLEKMLGTKLYRDERATRYALALSRLENNQTEGVQTQLDWLQQHDGDRVVYRLLAAQLAEKQNKPDAATDTYQKALQDYPQDTMLTLHFTQHLLNNQRFAAAQKVLLAKKHPFPAYYHLLARTYQATANPAAAYLAMAEYHYLRGDTGLAVTQLEQARKLKNTDFYLASQIEARYIELQRISRLAENTHL